MPHGKFSFNAHGQDSNLAHGMSLILRVCTRTLTNPWHRFGPTVDEEVREDHRRSERQSHARGVGSGEGRGPSQSGVHDHGKLSAQSQGVFNNSTHVVFVLGIVA